VENRSLSTAKRRLLDLLKVVGSSTAGELAAQVGLTGVAVRQHLNALETAGLVEQHPRPAAGRGRPSSAWRLASAAQSLFPDRHGELTVGLLDAVKQAFGAEGVDKVVQARAQTQIDDYRRRLPGLSASLRSRARALAEERTREGYMAEIREQAPGRYLLVEHHCPICEAAESCSGLCSVELDVFRAALGDDTEVERVSHLLSGDERCIYSIRRRGKADAAAADERAP
jgi:predicted ArsR family transcriptional regulator